MRRVLLAPFSWLYGIVVVLRNAAYDRGIFRTERAAVPVIAIGNLAAGGTGKTPLVEDLARFLSAKDLRVAVLSRGYGRRTTGFRVASDGTAKNDDASEVGDEPAQLACNLPGVIVAVDEDRVHGAEILARDRRAQVILLDDGFQHRQLGRDLDVVVMTAEELNAGDALLPAGDRREPIGGLRRARAVVISGVGDAEEFAVACRKLPSVFRGIVAGFHHGFRELRRAGSNTPIAFDRLRTKQAFAFSGIGRPAGFERTLREAGLKVVDHRKFPDHHESTDREIFELQASFQRSGAEILVTTQKDIVRLRSDAARRFLVDSPVHYAVVRPKWVAGGKEIERLVLDATRRKEYRIPRES